MTECCCAFSRSSGGGSQIVGVEVGGRERAMSLPRFGYCRRLYSGGPWENAGTHSSQIIQCAISCTGLFKKNLSLIFPRCVLLSLVKNMKLHEITCFSVVFKSLLHLKPGIQQYPLIVLLVQIESYLICHWS